MKKIYENVCIDIEVLSSTNVLSASSGNEDVGGYFDNELPLIPTGWLK